jgi:hypothetical protein
LLFAPYKGVETRRKIAEGTAEARKVLQKRIDLLEKKAIQFYIDNKGTWDIQLLSMLAEATGSSNEKLIASMEEKLAMVRRTRDQWRPKSRVIDVTPYPEAT